MHPRAYTLPINVTEHRKGADVDGGFGVVLDVFRILDLSKHGKIIGTLDKINIAQQIDYSYICINN